MNLEDRLKIVEDRNKRVELDKAWETSLSRKVVILSLTYLVVVTFMYFFEISQPFLNAVVPSLAFVLSTLTLPFVERWWLKKNK